MNRIVDAVLKDSKKDRRLLKDLPVIKQLSVCRKCGSGYRYEHIDDGLEISDFVRAYGAREVYRVGGNFYSVENNMSADDGCLVSFGLRVE